MPWSNARTCRQPGHATVARLAPRLTTGQLLLVVGLVCWLGSVPAVTRARPQGPGATVEGAADPSAMEKALAWAGDGADYDPLNQTANENRASRSLSVFPNIVTKKWLVHKGGSYIVIHRNGTVGTTKEVEPMMGILVFSSTIQNLTTSASLFTTSPAPKRGLTTMKGHHSNYYLCMNKTGRVYARKDLVMAECGFNETVQDHSYTSFCKPPRGRAKKARKCRMKCLGISSRGRIRPGNRVCNTDETAKFSAIGAIKTSPAQPTHRFPDLMPTMPAPPKNKTRPTRPTTGRRRKNRRRKGRRRKGRRKQVGSSRNCDGLFCGDRNVEGRDDWPSGGGRRNREPNKRRRAQRRHRRRRWKHRRFDARSRRDQDQGTPEEGPLSDVR